MSAKSPGPAASPWWSADRHADRRPALLARGRIKTALRSWFLDQGFLEVEPGCLQVSPGNETHLHAFATDLVSETLDTAPLYLHTSPEFAMKKLLAAGEQRIFTFAPTFRNRERGPLHAPEFTMLEWYRAGARYDRLWADCADILRVAADACAAEHFRWREMTCDPRAQPRCITVRDMLRGAHGPGVDLDDILPAANTDLTALEQLAETAANRNAPTILADASDWGLWFSAAMTHASAILGTTVPAILTEYPSIESALASPVPADPRYAERFELFSCGVELANGFSELIDPVLQRAKLEAQMQERQRLYGERYPLDEEFLAALADMPPAAGCALGFERLVMLAIGAPNIDHVTWTPLP